MMNSAHSSCTVDESDGDCIITDCTNIAVAGTRVSNTCNGVFPLRLQDLFFEDPVCAGNYEDDDDDDIDDGKNKKASSA